MKKFNSKIGKYSIAIAVLIILLVPSQYHTEGMGNYIYGFPFTTFTFYQTEPHSKWFMFNFFTGNDGLSIDPLSFLLNVLIYYWIIGIFVYRITNVRAK